MSSLQMGTKPLNTCTMKINIILGTFCLLNTFWVYWLCPIITSSSYNKGDKLPKGYGEGNLSNTLYHLKYQTANCNLNGQH